MPEANNIEIYSEEIQELMGLIPNKIIRWGLTVLLFSLSGIIVGSYFFKSPELIVAPIVLTTQNPPVSLVSRSTGKIDKLFAQEGVKVKKGKIIALINNPTNYEDYLRIKKELSINSDYTSWDEQVLTFELSTNTKLGELQPSYSSYIKCINNFKHYLNQNLIPQKIGLLESQINKQQEYYKTLGEQQEIQKRDIRIAEKAFYRDSLLFASHTISESDYEKSRQSLLAKKFMFIGFNATLKNIESMILQLLGSKVEMKMQYEKELSQFRLDLDESKQNLENQISEWEQKYFVISPIDGKVTYTSIWSENQEVKSGDLIGTIIPQDNLTIVAKAFIPTRGFGKVEIGQNVNIKLDAFPYMEYGILRGKIHSISLVPDVKGYIANIELEKGMLSSYKENLKFIQQMNGTAEIITKDLRLISRFINPLKMLFKNNF